MNEMFDRVWKEKEATGVNIRMAAYRVGLERLREAYGLKRES